MTFLNTDRQQQTVIDRHAEQAETNHEETGDRTGFEGNVERRDETVAGGFGGTHIGADRYVHADVTGDT